MVVLDLARWKSPAALQLLVVMMLHMDCKVLPREPPVQFIELFAGKGEVSQAFREQGWTGSSHDINTSPYMDLCTAVGFLLLGRQTRSL